MLLGVAFISQIGLISVLYPWRLRARAQASGFYALANLVIGAIGLVLLAVLLSLDTEDHMTGILLSIAFFFLLQLSPLVLPGLRPSWSRLKSTRAQRDTTDADIYRSTRLLDVVDAPAVGIAAVLFLSYLGLAWSEWGGEFDTHLVKMAVFATTQLLFVGSIAWSVSSLRRATTGQAGERYQNLKRLAPLFVFASIMISAYYFGKELLAVIDEPRLRPAMMSVFLQVLAVLGVNALDFGGNSP